MTDVDFEVAIGFECCEFILIGCWVAIKTVI